MFKLHTTVLAEGFLFEVTIQSLPTISAEGLCIGDLSKKFAGIAVDSSILVYPDQAGPACVNDIPIQFPDDNWQAVGNLFITTSAKPRLCLKPTAALFSPLELFVHKADLHSRWMPAPELQTDLIKFRVKCSQCKVADILATPNCNVLDSSLDTFELGIPSRLVLPAASWRALGLHPLVSGPCCVEQVLEIKDSDMLGIPVPFSSFDDLHAHGITGTPVAYVNGNLQLKSMCFSDSSSVQSFHPQFQIFAGKNIVFDEAYGYTRFVKLDDCKTIMQLWDNELQIFVHLSPFAKETGWLIKLPESFKLDNCPVLLTGLDDDAVKLTYCSPKLINQHFIAENIAFRRFHIPDTVESIPVYTQLDGIDFSEAGPHYYKKQDLKPQTNDEIAARITAWQARKRRLTIKYGPFDDQLLHRDDEELDLYFTVLRNTDNFKHNTVKSNNLCADLPNVPIFCQWLQSHKLAVHDPISTEVYLPVELTVEFLCSIPSFIQQLTSKEQFGQLPFFIATSSILQNTILEHSTPFLASTVRSFHRMKQAAKATDTGDQSVTREAWLQNLYGSLPDHWYLFSNEQLQEHFELKQKLLSRQLVTQADLHLNISFLDGSRPTIIKRWLCNASIAISDPLYQRSFFPEGTTLETLAREPGFGQLLNRILGHWGTILASNTTLKTRLLAAKL